MDFQICTIKGNDYLKRKINYSCKLEPSVIYYIDK